MGEVFAGGFALLVVLFILLIIIGASWLYYAFFRIYTVKEISTNEEISKINIDTLINRNTLSCRSSGISLTRHNVLVSLFMKYKINTAATIK